MVKQGQNVLKNQSGQAAVEYILLLVITVTIIIAVSKTLKSGKETVVDGYMSGYFKCLMAYGELPSLGVQDGDLKKNKCSLKKANAATSSGAAASGGPKGGSSGGAGTSIGSTEATASQRGGSTTGSENNSSTGQSGSTGLVSKKASKNASRSQGFSGTADGESGEDNTQYISGSNRPINRTDNTPSASNKTKKIASLDARNNKKLIKTDKIVAKSSISVKEEEENKYFRGPRKSAFMPPERKVAAQVEEDDESAFGFGKMFKWLVIIGIGITIFVFLGGQVLNYSKSDSN